MMKTQLNELKRSLSLHLKLPLGAFKGRFAGRRQ
jgi:hypothetical protein